MKYICIKVTPHSFGPFASISKIAIVEDQDQANKILAEASDHFEPGEWCTFITDEPITKPDS